MKILLALTWFIALIVISCVPGNQGGSFGGVPGGAPAGGIETGSARSAALPQNRTRVPDAERPAEDEVPQIRPGDMLPSDPVFGDENPGDFLIRPKHQSIHI